MAFNQDTPIIGATAVTRMQAEALSTPDKIGAFATGAVLSGLNSLYNSAAAIPNFFGAGIERADTYRQLTDLDQNWADYYKQNQDAIDTVGFVAASLIPSTIAVKALNAVRMGEPVGAIGRALGYTATKQTQYLEAAMKELATEGGTVYSKLNSNFLKSITFGYADNALQSAAASIATVATMHASPLLEGKDIGTLGWEIAKDTLLGGAIGGSIETLFANGIYKGAAKAVDAKLREIDGYSFESRTSINFGDKAYTALSQLESISKDVLDQLETTVDYAFTLNGRQRTIGLDTSKLVDNAVARKTRKVFQDLELTLREATGDELAGSSLASGILNLYKEGNKLGATEHDIRSKLGGILMGMEGASSIGYKGTTNLFEAELRHPEIQAKLAEVEDKALRYWSDYHTTQDPKKVIKAKELDAQAKKLRNTLDENINANTTNTAPVATFFNTKTGSFSFETLPHIGDMQVPGARIDIKPWGVSVGNKIKFEFDPAKLLDPSIPSSLQEATARHLWARELDFSKFPKRIHEEDISLLDALAAKPNFQASDIKIVSADGQSETTIKSIYQANTSFNTWLEGHKAKLLEDYVQRYNAPDVQELAYRLNTTHKWVEDTIAKDFKPGADGFIKNVDDYLHPENLKLTYNNESGFKPFFLDAQVDFTERMKLADEKFQTAAKIALGNETDKLIAPDSDWTKITEANREGAGATLLGAANANYSDKLAAFAQYTGAQVARIGQKVGTEKVLKLQPLLTKVASNQSAFVEYASIRNMIRSTDEKMVLMGVDKGFPGTYLVSRDMAELAQEDIEAFTAWKERAIVGASGTDKIYKIENADVADLLRTMTAQNDARIIKKKAIAAAHGMSNTWQEGTVYFPPIDTSAQPFVAFVKTKDARLFGRTDVGVITAKSEADLLEQANKVNKEHFDVWFKRDTEQFFKAKGEYEYAQTLHESSINSELKKAGVMFEFTPNFSKDQVLGELVQFTQRAEMGVVRDAVSSKYHRLFTELGHLSDEYTLAATSKTGYLNKVFARTVNDPYGDYIRTALNISKKAEYTILQQTNDFLDAVGARAYRAIDKAHQAMKSGDLSWDEVKPTLQRYGFGTYFQDESLFKAAQVAPDKNIFKEYINKANMLLATTSLRLDFLNPMINVLSTPVLLSAEVQSIRKEMLQDPKLAAIFDEQTKVVVPGTKGEKAVNSTMRLLSNAVKTYFNEPKKLAEYEAIGLVDGTLALHHKMLDDLGRAFSYSEPSKVSQLIESAVSKGEKITGNLKAEQFTRFVSANVMDQIVTPAVKAGKISAQEANALKLIFVNRVNGNYLASQRPILFQGTTGAAIGMFQTYTFNMMQQLFRYVENRDAAAVATMLGMQTSLYGMNGLPGFDAINTHIIGNSNLNSSHADMYLRANQVFGKEMGEWLMYGTASAMPFFSEQHPALFTRGDLNPRYPTIVPTNPMDVPAFQAGVKAIAAIERFVDGFTSDQSVKTAMLQGLEHNGFSRPLAGLAQVLQGASTTQKGNLIAANQDLVSIASLSRILGAKPMDESIARNEQFRELAYQAKDRARLEAVASNFKRQLINGDDVSSEQVGDMLAKYVAAGGRVENYTKALKTWTKDATRSQTQQIMEAHRTPYALRMLEIAGADAATPQ